MAEAVAEWANPTAAAAAPESDAGAGWADDAAGNVAVGFMK